jgi:hypothetical protein
MATTEELAARLAALEAQVRELQARVRAAEDQPARLMREVRRCPACRGESILFVEQFAPVKGMPLRVSYVGAFSIKSLGVVQACVCASCGYTEMQIEDPASLVGLSEVRELQSLHQNEGGPYR